MKRELADVLETVRRAKDRDKACTVLIGAGFSVKAGIPTATQFVEIIRKDYPRAYDRASKKSYPHVMGQLSMAERRDLISTYIDKANINWAHIALAQLIKHGYVNRVLTVNFDPLVMRACALVGVFPAVYDFAASQNFNPNYVSPQSVFYLHGQHTSFVVLNTEAEVNRLSQHLEPVFTDTIRGHVWIVIGYSGDNDPVFTHLARIERFDNNLYWVCYKDDPAPPHVQKQLLIDGKDCFSINGFDADDFVVALAQGVGAFPPEFVQTPFTHLDKLLEPVLPYSLPGNSLNLEAIPKKLLQEAIESIEKPSALTLRANDLLLAGQFNKVIELEGEYRKTRSSSLGEAISRAYISLGNQLVSVALSETTERNDLWVEAVEKYAAALDIKPNMADALNNWAIALSLQANTKSGKEADRLWALAGEKFAAALRINPELHAVLYNWGTMLLDQAVPKSGEKAERLWASAAEKYAAALKIKPDFHEALSNWALTLDNQARTKTGEEADRLWEQAGEKYAAALETKPDKHSALYKWGLALQAQAKTKTGMEATRLSALAEEKLAAAREIAPDVYHHGQPEKTPTPVRLPPVKDD